jgi:death-on-curing protein
MNFLELADVLELHRLLIEQSGGSPEIHDLGAVDSAVAQPRMTFGGQELYPTLGEKASALGFSLIKNHGFKDGNKRVGHAAMEIFLVLNGFEIASGVDEQESVILDVAAGRMTREAFTAWVCSHIVPKP